MSNISSNPLNPTADQQLLLQQQQQQQIQQIQQQSGPPSISGSSLNDISESSTSTFKGSHSAPGDGSAMEGMPLNLVMPAVSDMVVGRVSPRAMLTVVPDEKRHKGPGTRRAFQPRRRSRACDQCRTRKTKVRRECRILVTRLCSPY